MAKMGALLADHPGQNYAASDRSRSVRVIDVVATLLLHPIRYIRLWNWKSAVLSIVLRGPIFVVASFRRGWAAAISALLVESVFCALTAGFYGTIVQALRDAQPAWLTGLLITLVMPSLFQALEYLMQRAHGTPHLHAAEIVSVVASALSALFNWYAMRQGALLVGSEGRPLGGDVRRFPLLLYRFLTLPVRWISKYAWPRRGRT
jgi:hypothetical protein